MPFTVGEKKRGGGGEREKAIAPQFSAGPCCNSNKVIVTMEIFNRIWKAIKMAGEVK